MKGLGNDIIAIKRIKEVMDKHGQRFLDRTYTLKEQEYCNKHKESLRNYAGRWAAKEAIAKAFGTGFGEESSLLDIEILNDSKGKPFAYLSTKLQKNFGEVSIHVSISHCKEYATAVAIIE